MKRKKSFRNKTLKLLDSRRYSNEDCCLLGCDSVQFGRYLQTFWTNLLPPCTELMGGKKNKTKFVLKWVKRAKARLWKKKPITNQESNQWLLPHPLFFHSLFTRSVLKLHKALSWDVGHYPPNHAVTSYINKITIYFHKPSVLLLV